MKRLSFALLLVLAGCGGEEPLPPDPPPVRLTITQPADTATTDNDTIELKGRVSPSRASVLVSGEPTRVTQGTFSVDVPLEEGANVIDVQATMPGRSAAFAALRVNYDPRVAVPVLKGVPDDEAADRIAKLGLEPGLEAVGGLLDEFRSGERRVCETDPPAGTLVEPGANVTLRTSKSC